MDRQTREVIEYIREAGQALFHGMEQLEGILMDQETEGRFSQSFRGSQRGRYPQDAGSRPRFLQSRGESVGQGVGIPQQTFGEFRRGRGGDNEPVFGPKSGEPGGRRAFSSKRDEGEEEQGIPLDKSGTPDRRTKEGRLATDAEEYVASEDELWEMLEEAPVNEDGTIDLRTKQGRALRSAQWVDDNGRLHPEIEQELEQHQMAGAGTGGRGGGSNRPRRGGGGNRGRGGNGGER